MLVAKYLGSDGHAHLGVVEDDVLIPLTLDGRQYRSLSDVLEDEDPAATVQLLRADDATAIPLAQVTLLAPIDRQEVWAAGVTYKRSQVARMEESEAAASVYDRVYTAARPELFFKATPGRVSGPHQPLRIRRDATWNVPEPELALVLNSRMQIVGYTIGNDMSSRDIEGENPLYLPQAKVYDQCCGLGPAILLATASVSILEAEIKLDISRGGAVVFTGRTSVANMARQFGDLVGYLGRDNSFPAGAVLLTGTGVVPNNEFTLKPGDVVRIDIEGIGALINPIVQG